MPSDYEGFELKIDLGDGTEHYLPGETIEVWDVEDADPETGVGAIQLSDLVTDGDGMVAAGTLPIDAGRRVRFRWIRDADGRCVSDTQITT